MTERDFIDEITKFTQSPSTMKDYFGTENMSRVPNEPMLGKKEETQKSDSTKKSKEGGMWEAALMTIAMSVGPLLGRNRPVISPPRPVQAPAASVGSAPAVRIQSPFGESAQFDPNILRSYLGGGYGR